MFDTSIIISICTVIGAIIAVGGIISRYERRQTTVSGIASSALQTSAEAEEELKSMAKTMLEFSREVPIYADRVRREFGETVQAMQSKIQEFEKWSRDEFVHNKSFENAIARQERSAEQRDERMEKRLERIERKLDEQSTFRVQGQNTL